MKSLKLIILVVGLISLTTGPAASYAANARAAPSPLATKTLKAMGRRVRHVTTRYFDIHSPEADVLHWVSDAADSLFELSDRWLRGEYGKPAVHDSTERLALFLVDGRTWENVLRKSGLRGESSAMQAGRELFVLLTPERGELTHRISHEIAHERVRRYFGPHLPVWLEEGLASMVGWHVATTVRKARGWSLTRMMETNVVALRDFSVDNVVRWNASYPPGIEERAYFQRQTEALVHALHQYLGYRNFIEFVRALSQSQQSWDDILRSQFDFVDVDFIRVHENARTELLKGE